MPKMIYEINTAVWLSEQPWAKGGRADLADVPEEVIEAWKGMGVEVVWFLGVWRIGEATRHICLGAKDLCANFEAALPGSVPDQVAGSPFSIFDYALRPEFGNETTLPRLREKLHAHGIRLMLDFVANHMAVDHPWVQTHPDRFVRGSEVLLEREGGNYFRVPGRPEVILAHGRDPYFSGWTDTVQVNIFSKETRAALTEVLLGIAAVCDGVRCDMAMLLKNDVFMRTWGDLSIMDFGGEEPPEFWTEAIGAVKRQYPDFVLMAEVYWGLEPQLQEMGFDYTYDKSLYDRLRAGDGAAIRQLLLAPLDLQKRSARFIENHDESRAAVAFEGRERAAATLISGLPGVVLYHEGQFEGRRVHVPVQLKARPDEPVNESLRELYDRLLSIAQEPVVRDGDFRGLEVRQAWDENESAHVIVTYFLSLGAERRLVVANVGTHQAQAYTAIPLDAIDSDVMEFRDLLSDACYYRSRRGLEHKGLYLDMGPDACHVFQVQAAPEGRGADPDSE